jgi:hypothetical protein
VPPALQAGQGRADSKEPPLAALALALPEHRGLPRQRGLLPRLMLALQRCSRVQEQQQRQRQQEVLGASPLLRRASGLRP